MNVQLNDEQKLYVIPCGDGFSSFGYENARRDTAHIAAALGRPDLQPTAAEFGTLQGYAKYRSACAAWANSTLSKGTWFTPGTDPTVAKLLERYRSNGRLLRIFLGDRDSGRDWMEESDVVGCVGRSTGSQKVPLLIEPGESGGPAILTDSIVRMMDADGTELWRHPRYQTPKLALEVEHDASKRAKGYRWAVWHADSVHARFKDLHAASEYVEFITGRIATKRDQLVTAMQAA